MTGQPGVPGIEEPLTPEEVLRPHFPRAVMGYDRTEVDYFLEVVAVQQRRLLDKVAELETAALGPRTGRDNDDKRLTDVLDRAARVIDERRQAHRIRTDAEISR